MSEGGWGPEGTGQPVPGDDNRQPAPDSGHRGSPVRSKIIIGALAAAVGIAGGALWVGLARGPSPAVVSSSPAPSSAPQPAAATPVQLERTSSAGASPFMSPIGQDQPNVMAPSSTGGELLGSTPGLFADAGDKPSCDAPTLIANLGADTVKATAWATALGLQSKDIPTYVAGLTPVLLRSDTAVTSHGYDAPRFVAYPAVLQAGTAVFVNSNGEPKAKCFSGNPLTQPIVNPQANYVGPAWGGFAPKSVTIIKPTPTAINNYDLVNVHNGQRVPRPAGHHPSKGKKKEKHCTQHAGPHQCKNEPNNAGNREACQETAGRCIPRSDVVTGQEGVGEAKCQGEADCEPTGSINSRLPGNGGGTTCGSGQIKNGQGKCVPKSRGPGGGGDEGGR